MISYIFPDRPNQRILTHGKPIRQVANIRAEYGTYYGEVVLYGQTVKVYRECKPGIDWKVL